MEQNIQQKLNFKIPSLLKVLLLVGIIFFLVSFALAYIFIDSLIVVGLLYSGFIVSIISILLVFIILLKRNFGILFKKPADQAVKRRIFYISLFIGIFSLIFGSLAWVGFFFWYSGGIFHYALETYCTLVYPGDWFYFWPLLVPIIGFMIAVKVRKAVPIIINSLAILLAIINFFGGLTVFLSCGYGSY